MGTNEKGTIMKLKTLLLKTLLLLPIILLSACDTENQKTPGGNEMITGSKTYYYAYVKSQITGNTYYHISGWAEYGPEGGDVNQTYVGLELQLAVSKDVIYYYEPNLCYLLSKQYNPTFGRAIE